MKNSEEIEVAVEIEPALTDQEQGRLIELEGFIRTGVATFIQVGESLAEIKDKELYRAEFRTFEIYCKSKWDFTARRAYQLIEASAVVEELPAHLRTAVHTESAARALADEAPRKRKQILDKIKKQRKKKDKQKPITAPEIKEAARPRGGLAGEKLAADKRKKEASSGARGKMLAALQDWWKEQKPTLTAYTAATPAEMVEYFVKLIKKTL